MVKTGGFFLKGLASSLQGMPQRVFEVRWKTKEEKKLQAKQNELREVLSLYTNTVTELQKDGWFSQDDIMKLDTIMITGGAEFQDLVKNTHSHIQEMNQAQVEQDFELVDSFIEMTKGIDLKDMPGALETIRRFVKSEGALTKLKAYDNIYKMQYKTTQEEKALDIAGKLPQEYKYPYLKEKGIVGEITPTTEAPKLTDTQVKLAEIDKLTFLTEERRNKMKVQLLVKDSAWAEKVKDARAAGATDEDIVEMAGGGVIGPEPTVKPKTIPAPTSIENIRADILNADTFEDAQRIYKNYADKYDEKSLMINLPKDWSDTQSGYLMNLRTCVNKLIDERGWLKKGTITQVEVGLEFKGEQPVEEVYKRIRKEYMKYRDMLEKLGIDVSQFPILKPLEEIEKVGFGEGFWGWGKQEGQYKSIYQ